MFLEKFLIDHISSPLCNNDILSLMIYFHPYYIQEGPVRSIIIINIIVIVVIIQYCYRIIVISCPQSVCVLFDWSVITQQEKGWYSWLYSLVGTIKTNHFFFCDNNLILTPTPLPPHLSILKLWSKFILGLNFIFFCFKLIIVHYNTQKPTYRGRNQPRLLILVVDF